MNYAVWVLIRLTLYLIIFINLLYPAFADEDCDCQWYAYRALRRIDLRLRTFPAVVQDQIDQSKYPGATGMYSAGRVTVLNVGDCKRMVHEFVHHYQLQQYGLAHDKIHWDLNEQDAKIITARAINAYGECR